MHSIVQNLEVKIYVV